MFKTILAFLGFRSAKRALRRERALGYGRRAGLPVGGLFSLGLLAWRNRDSIRSLFRRGGQLPAGSHA